MAASGAESLLSITSQIEHSVKMHCLGDALRKLLTHFLLNANNLIKALACYDYVINFRHANPDIKTSGSSWNCQKKISLLKLRYVQVHLHSLKKVRKNFFVEESSNTFFMSQVF